MTKGSNPQLQMVLINVLGRERENVKAAISDLNLFMKGKLNIKKFFDGNCTHSLNVLMWVLRHGNHSFTVHAARAQIDNIGNLLKNLKYSMTVLINAWKKQKELREVSNELYGILLQAGNFYKRAVFMQTISKIGISPSLYRIRKN